MLSIIKDHLTNLVNESKIIKLEDAMIHSENKLVVIISKNDYMASFEVMSNLEYDFLVVNSNDEVIILNKSKKLYNISELLSEIEEDFNSFSEQ